MGIAFSERERAGQASSSTKAKEPSSTLARVTIGKGKSLAREENENLRRVLREIIERDFDGAASRAAGKIGVSVTMLHEFLHGTRGAGTKLIFGVSNYTGRGIDDLLGRAVTVHPDTQAVREGDELRQHPQWRAVSAQFVEKLERRGQKPDPEVMEETGTASFSRALPVLTVEFVARLYEALLQAKEDAEEIGGPKSG